MMKRLLFTLLVLFTATVCAQPRSSQETRAVVQSVARGVQKGSDIMLSRYGISRDGYVGVLAVVDTMAYDRAELEQAGIMVGAKVGDVLSLRMPVALLPRLDKTGWIRHYEVARPVTPLLDRTRMDTRTDSVHQGIGLAAPFDGSGVLIGITDWGFDYTHPNINSRQEKRVLRAWDQFRTAGPPPAGFSYGTEIIGYDSLVAKQCDTYGLYGYGTHGTHVAGIAAGRGLNGHYAGQAPKANLLFGSWFLDEASWIDQVQWMFNVSKQERKRLVINSSWGMYRLGTMDGQSILSRAINSYSDSGVVFVTSGGNNGDAKFHIEQTFGTDDTLGSIATYYVNGIGQVLTYWGDPGQDFSVGFCMSRDGRIYRSPLYATAADITYMDSMMLVDGDTVRYNLTTEHANPYNNRPHAILTVYKLYNTKLHMLAVADSGTHLHVWNVCEVENHAGNTGNDFENGGFEGYRTGDKYFGVGEPAVADKCISVAAHIADRWRNDTTYMTGGLTSFSSWGPTLSGKPKPEVSAPGSAVVSSISSFYSSGAYEPVVQTFVGGRPYIWASMSGTSMSSPAVSGIVALMLQANPNLTVDTIRAILFRTARNDDRTGPLHERDSVSICWGYGKVDALRAVAAAYDLLDINTATRQPLPMSVWPNPASGYVNIELWTHRIAEVSLYDMAGRCLRTATVAGRGTLSTQGLQRGVYILKASADGRIATSKVVVCGL